MSRLIDADKLIEEMRKWYWDEEKQKVAENDISPMDLFTNLAISTVKEQPTAFDMEKVVHELQNLRMDIFEKVKKGYPTEATEDYFNCGKLVGKNYAYRDCIEIVKRGGRNEE